MGLIISMSFDDGRVVAAEAQWSADSLTCPDKSILWVLRASCGCEFIAPKLWPCPQHRNARSAVAGQLNDLTSRESPGNATLGLVTKPS